MHSVVERHDEVDQTAWDTRLLSVREGTFHQSTSYGELCRTMLYEEPLYIRVEDEGHVMGQLLCFDSYWLRDRIAPWGRQACRLWRRTVPARRWHYGPVIFDPEAAEIVTRELLRIATAGRDVSHGLPAVHGLPEGHGTDATIPAEWDFAVQSQGTLLLPVKASLDELWQKLSPDAKRNVRRAAREGLTICDVDSEARLVDFYQVQAENRRRRGLPAKPFQQVAETNRLSCHHAFLSVVDGVPISAQGAIVWNGIVSLIGCSISDVGFKRGLHGNDLMQWHVIQWARSIEARLVDWVGYSLNPTTRQDGINRFKAKWGGQLVVYNTYCRIHPALRLPLRWYRGDGGKPVAAG